MASKYIILDTNIISEAQKPRPRPEVSEWLSRLSPAIVAIPFSAVFETSYGIKLVERTHPDKAVRLMEWQRQLLSFDFVMPQCTPEVARLLAQMASARPLKHYWLNPTGPSEKSRRLNFGSDPLIAATAIAHEMPIATLDVRDFALINHYFPLPGLFDPMSGEWIIGPPAGWSFELQADAQLEESADTWAAANVIRLRA